MQFKNDANVKKKNFKARGKKKSNTAMTRHETQIVIFTKQDIYIQREKEREREFICSYEHYNSEREKDKIKKIKRKYLVNNITQIKIIKSYI